MLGHLKHNAAVDDGAKKLFSMLPIMVTGWEMTGESWLDHHGEDFESLIVSAWLKRAEVSVREL